MMMLINASNEPPRGELRDSPNDDHRVSVIIFEDQGSFGVLFCEGPGDGSARVHQKWYGESVIVFTAVAGW